MGTSTNAMLMYGYHLGGDEGGWEMEGAGEYGGLPAVPWYDPDAEDGDIVELMMHHLLAEIAGFTETDWKADGYFDRKRVAEQQVGVTIESHCSGEFPMWVLCAKAITAYRGDVHVVDPPWLISEPVKRDWTEKLNAAIEALGIRPTQQRPEWLLCSYWG
jgi:hypothetical protein